MQATHVRIYYEKLGGHYTLTFFTGVPDFTFANIGSLVCDAQDLELLRDVMGRAGGRVEWRERGDGR